MIARIQHVAVIVGRLLGCLFTDHTFTDQAFRIKGTSGRVGLDLLVHQRLGGRRLIRLIVAKTAIADQVDDHVFLELHAVIHRQLGDEVHRFRVVRIHMEDRCLHHLRHVGAVFGGTGILTSAGSEAHLIVDDYMQGAASLEATGLRHLEGFHDHTLTCESGIAVQQNRYDLFAFMVFSAILAGSHRALHHRRHDFQVRRVERHGQMDFTAGGLHIGGKALVILHITGTGFDKALAIEFLEQILGTLAQGVDQHIQTTPVGHANDQFLGSIAAHPLNDFVHQRNQ